MSSSSKDNEACGTKESPNPELRNVISRDTDSHEPSPAALSHTCNSRLSHCGDSTNGSFDSALIPRFENENKNSDKEQFSVCRNHSEDEWDVEMDHEEEDNETELTRNIVRLEDHADSDIENEEGPASGNCSEDLFDEDGNPRLIEQPRGASLLRNLMQQGSIELSDSNLIDVMQRIVGGMGESSFGRQSSEYDQLLENLGQTEEPYLVLETLNELLERLLMMNGYTAERLIPASRLTKAIILILNNSVLSEELELHLVACRCLYNLIEVNQDFINHALNKNAVKALVERVSEITYIDLTEQALQTLEIISGDTRSHPLLVECDGLEAFLKNLDFLTVHAQRKCLIIFANACTNLSRSSFSLTEAAFPLLSQVVENHRDGLVIENAWLAMSRIITSYNQEPEYTERLFNNKSLLNQMVDIITKSCNPSTAECGLNYQSNISLLKSLNIISAGSIKISDILLDSNIGSQICVSLNRFKKDEAKNEYSSKGDENVEEMPFEAIAPIEAVIAAPKNLLLQFLQLIESIIPKSGEYASPTLNGNIAASAQSDMERKDVSSKCESSRFWKFVNTVWPVLIHSFQGSMDVDVRSKVLVCVYKIAAYSKSLDLIPIKNFNMIFGALNSVASSSRKFLTADSIEQFLSSATGLAEVKQIDAIFYVFMILEAIFNKLTSELFHLLERDGLFSDILSLTDTVLLSLNSFSKSEYNITEVESDTDKPPLKSLSNSTDTQASGHPNFLSPLRKTLQKVAYVGKHLEELYQVRKNLIVTPVVENPILDKVIIGLTETLSNPSNFEWDVVWASFKTLLDSPEYGISNFELMNLGLINLLLKLLGQERINEPSSASSVLSSCKDSFVRTLYTNNESISRLIQIIEGSLSRRESFDVYVSGINPIYNLTNRTASMAKQVKIRLIPALSFSANTGLAFNNMDISVHAVATFKSIRAFMQQRFKFNLRRPSESSPALKETNKCDEDMRNYQQETPFGFDFFIEKEAIPDGTTVFGAVFKKLQMETNSPKIDPSDIWNKQHIIFYKPSNSENEATNRRIVFEEDDLKFCDDETESLFSLLKVLFELNQKVKQLFPEYDALSTEKFRSWNLTAKFNRQMEEILIVASGTLPNWCIRIAKDFSFLLPLETKILFMQSTSFGYSRLIHSWQLRTSRELPDQLASYSHNGISATSGQVGRTSRIKARISRDQFFPSALKVLQAYGSSPNVLEIEYYDEAGSGLGPTMEFYSTTSKEFCRKDLMLWREDFNDSDVISNSGDYLSSKSGLFPRPLDPKKVSSVNGQKVIYLFSKLGKLIARALIDSRMVDFDFNPVFLAMIRNPKLFSGEMREKVSDEFKLISVLKLIDPKLASSLEHLISFLRSEKSRHEKETSGVNIEDLSLTFVLPGYPNYELIPNGSEIYVTGQNLAVFLDKVVESSIFSGVFHQMKAFVEGFSEVFPISSLSIFTSDELSEIFGSSTEDWSKEALSDAIKPNHGYSQDSITIERLINVLVKLSAIDRRKFLKFLTGSSRLPIGGFKSMHPEFTVVRKYPEDNLTSDDYLPSVMTCANYLKLPDYSLEAIMSKKLIDAITEGADAFHLS